LRPTRRSGRPRVQNVITTHYQFPLYAAPNAAQVAKDNAAAEQPEGGAGGDEPMDSDTD